jgi:copper(I)-binding protein
MGFSMRLPIAVAIAALTLSACSPAEENGPAETVENAWVRLPAVDGRPAAAYFILNGGEAGDTLLAIDSERVATIELHQTTMDGGAMRMRPIMSTDMPVGAAVAFEPGGRHAMLFGIDPEITPGTTLSLNFRFDSGRDVRIEAITIAAGDSSTFDSEKRHGAD